MENSTVSSTPSHSATSRVHYYAWFLVGWLLMLIFYGGMVKSTNSGLSVPDWPNTYGHFMFSFPWDRMVGGIYWEHSHRMIASIAGLLTIVLAVWVWKVDRRKWVRNLSLGTVGVVVTLGVLGGTTVLNQLPAWNSTAHGTLAQLYLSLVTAIAVAVSPSWKRIPDGLVGKQLSNQFRFSLQQLTVFTVVAIFVQLVLGAVMRHTEAGLVIPDFPMMFGGWAFPLSDEAIAFANQELARNGILSKLRLPEVTRAHMLVHLAHRLWALVVTAMVIWTTVRVFRSYRDIHWLVRNAILLAVLTAIQITFGILTIYTEKQPSIATLHVVIGAATLATAAALSLRAFHYKHLADRRIGVPSNDRIDRQPKSADVTLGETQKEVIA